ncbi:MAG: hypothetical protein Q8R53_02330 [Nanoarchaeota archaeon]|nr:hypothetical protein [Nanoarchaeota archaeon]
MEKRGQGLSLNVIIIAVLAIIVLVVLVAIFAGRIGIFESQLGGEAQSELRAMESFYGQCHPNAAAETAFVTTYNAAVALENVQEAAQGKGDAKATFEREIDRCNGYSDKAGCDADEFCAW